MRRGNGDGGKLLAPAARAPKIAAPKIGEAGRNPTRGHLVDMLSLVLRAIDPEP